MFVATMNIGIMAVMDLTTEGSDVATVHFKPCVRGIASNVAFI